MKRYGKFEFDNTDDLNGFDVSIELYIYKLKDLRDAETESERIYAERAKSRAETELIKYREILGEDVVESFLTEKQNLLLTLQKNPDVKMAKESGLLTGFDAEVFADRIESIVERSLKAIEEVREFYKKSPVSVKGE